MSRFRGLVLGFSEVLGFRLSGLGTRFSGLAFRF